MGVWIKGAAIDKILGPGEHLKLRSLCSVRRSELQCPSDGQKLYEGKIGPVIVDLCHDCHGLWLDNGELKALLARKPISPHVPSESSVPLNHTDSSLTNEILLLGLFSLM